MKTRPLAAWLRTRCIVILLLAILCSMGCWSSLSSTAQAKSMTPERPITSSVQEHPANFVIMDSESGENGGPGVIVPFLFTLNGYLRWDIQLGPPVLPAPPVTLTHIYQDASVPNGANPQLPFSFMVGTSVDVLNGDGSLYTTLSIQRPGCIHSASEAVLCGDTFGSYMPRKGNRPIILKHNEIALADNGQGITVSYNHNM